MAIKKSKRKRTLEDWIIDTIVTVVMVLIIIITVYPFYYCVILAFNNGIDATIGGIYFWPRVFSLENFKTLLADARWGHAIIISVSRTIVGTGLGLLATSAVAYALSFEHVMFRNTYYKLYIFTMYFSGGMIPFYILLKSLGMLNTFWVYVIPGMINVYFMLILINFFQTIPKELYEAAQVDGAGDLRVFFQIALPLSKASLATVALFYAVGHWNSWIDSVYYVTKNNLRTMSFLMMEIINKSVAASAVKDVTTQGYAASAVQTTSTSLQLAAMVLAVAPILMIYPFLQKYFVKGVMIGSVKG